MRKRFNIQYELGATPIEQVKFPARSRDELPRVLRGLQHIYATPELNKAIFDLLESQIIGDKNNRMGRPGMKLWEILVLGTVRLTLDADYDRLEHIANYDKLVRDLLGVTTFGEQLKRYPLQTLKDNVTLLDESLLLKINELVVSSGHQLVKKKEENEGLRVKVDSYVVESNVHFPTDVNLLWDACRKCLDMVGRLVRGVPRSGWRKHRALKRELKRHYQRVSRVMSRGGRRREARLQESVLAYLRCAGSLSLRLKSSAELFSSLAAESFFNDLLYKELSYYEKMLDKHIDLLRRRVIYKETIPHEEKMFSLFEPYTRWINKGKSGGRIELGLPVSIASDQHGFILDYYVMESESDVDVAVPLGERLIGRWGRLSSLSFDRGYWSPENYRRLCYRVEELIMPKKGGKNKAEQERESREAFIRLRCEHAGVESDINALEHHGLNRCPDKGVKHFRRYVGLGILSLNLHRLGNLLLARDRLTAVRRAAA